MTAGAPFVVGIAGGSGAGKSALARALAGALGPARVATLCYDAYYRDRRDLPAAARAALDYDAPDALDTPLFVDHLRALRAGVTVRPPRYCFSTHRRLGDDEPVETRPVVLAEGILLLHEPAIRELLDFSIFVEVPDRMRLARRMARDTAERGRTQRSVLAQFAATVRGAHARWVEPTNVFADVVLDNGGRLDRLAEIAVAMVSQRMRRREAAA